MVSVDVFWCLVIVTLGILLLFYIVFSLALIPWRITLGKQCRVARWTRKYLLDNLKDDISIDKISRSIILKNRDDLYEVHVQLKAKDGCTITPYSTWTNGRLYFNNAGEMVKDGLIHCGDIWKDKEDTFDYSSFLSRG